MTASGKEMDKQRQRIQQYKDDAADASIADRDEHDVRKQEEVLGEIIQGRAYEVKKLKEYAIALEQLLVRRARWCPGHAGSLTHEPCDRRTGSRWGRRRPT